MVSNWRTHPQETEGYLYIMRPRAVWTARVNMASATYPLAEITFDGSAPSTSVVEMGMTVLIGSTPGAWDLGHTYVRGDVIHDCITSTVLNIGYSSRGHRMGEVDLVDNAYITVLDLFEVWNRPSKGGSGPGSILKDYAWGSSEHFQPVVHVGNTGGIGNIGFTEGGELRQSFDARTTTNTNPVDPGWIDQRWDMKDGVFISGNVTSDTAVVDFPAGYRWIKRDVIDGNLRRGLPRRFCVVALAPEGGDPANNTGWIQTAYQISWTRKLDGQTLTANLSERLDPDDYLPGTVVMLMTRTKYRDVVGQWTLAFAGYLDSQRGTARANIHDTERGCQLKAIDVAGRMKQLRGTPTRMIRTAGIPENHNQMRAATIWRYLWWALFFHTSAPMLSDIDLDISGGDDFPFAFFANSGGSWWAIPDTLAKATLRRLTCDSQGVIRVVVDPLRLDDGERTATVQAEIEESDWTEIGRVQKRVSVGILKGSALPISETPAASLLAAINEWHGIAPGLVAGAGAGEQSLGYTMLTPNEALLWSALGHDYARLNSSEDRLRITLAHGADTGIEPALLEWITVTATEDNSGWMDAALTEARCLPEQVDFTLDDLAGTLAQSVVAELETSGTPGTRDPNFGPVVIRPVIRPPVRVPPPSTGFLLRGGETNLGFIDGGYLYYTLNGGLTWARIALNPTGTSLDFVPYAFSTLYRGTGNTVRLYHATTTRACAVDFNTTLLTALLTEQASYAAVSVARVETERAAEGLVAIAKAISATTTDIITTTDGTNWGSAEVINAGGGTYGPPALYVSGKAAGRIYTSENVVSGDADGLVSNDSGGTYGGLSSPNITSKGAAFGLHVPFDQPAEDIALFGSWDGAGQPRKILRANGAAQDDISPQDGGESWGAQLQRAIDSDPNDRNLVAACLRNGTGVGDPTDDMRLYYWLNGGLGAAQFISDLDETVGSGQALFNVRVAGDGSGVGWGLGSARIVKFRFEDGSYLDISGNLPSFSSPSIGIIPNLFGFGN